MHLTAAEARGIVLRAQGFVGSPYPPATGGLRRRTSAVGAVLDHLGAVQLDTISTLARSHELVPYARLGPVGRDAVETAYWGTGSGPASADPPTTFEYWSHAACLLSLRTWPLFAVRRRAFRRLGLRWHEVPTAALDRLRDQLHAEGPLTANALGGAKKGGEWWDWSDAKVGIEWLLDIGEVVCVRRVGWRRVYDLAERVIPADLLAVGTEIGGVVGPDDATCVRELVRDAARTLGVGTLTDLTDVHRLGTKHVPRAVLKSAMGELLDAGDLVEVSVAGWAQRGYADPAALSSGSRGRHRTTLLSPFDSLVWNRKRTSRVFGFDHTLEAYVPAERRVHGYFTMPVLHRGRLVARVDPKREGTTLHARQVTFESAGGGWVPDAAVRGTAAALREAATWVGVDQIEIGSVQPQTAATPLCEALGVLS